MKGITIVSLLLIWSLSLKGATRNQELIFGVQFGTATNDKPQGLALDDSANAYVSGYTYGNIGQANAGGQDGFLAKYSPAGQLVWTYQIGTNQDEWIYSVTVDKDYNCYIVGKTGGSLGGHSNAGGLDCFIAKLNPIGDTLWLYQFGSTSDDYIRKIALDSMNNIYACGYTYGQLGSAHFGGSDAFVIKLNEQGEEQWIKQYGTDQDEYCVSLTLDNNGHILVTGSTRGNWGGTNAGNYDNYVFYLNMDGDFIEIFQNGTGAEDEPLGIAVDEEGIMYVGGSRGNYANIMAMDSNGIISWDRQFGGGSSWSGTWEVKIFPDSTGDILAGGCLDWANSKAFMRRYTKEGTLVWENLLFNDESKMTNGKVVSINKDGDCYQIGYTTDSLFSEPIGGQDAFLIKVSGNQAFINNDSSIPDNFLLYQNHPNPFVSSTQIEYDLKKGTHVTLSIYNSLGQKIKTLVNNWQTAGNYKISWDASDDVNRQTGAGLYVYQLEANGHILNKQMLCLK